MLIVDLILPSTDAPAPAPTSTSTSRPKSTSSGLGGLIGLFPFPIPFATTSRLSTDESNTSTLPLALLMPIEATLSLEYFRT
jgi:hypothetical protein